MPTLSGALKAKKNSLKIVSLVPSITETLFSLGLNQEVVGITKFCVHPQDWFRSKTRIGGTKNTDIEKIKKLNPALIIANKEENVREQIEELGKKFKVLLTDVNNYGEALKMIETIGESVNKAAEAGALVRKIDNGFTSFPKTKTKSALYFIWKDPYMTVGGDTFINDMMRKAGFKNIFDDQLRYPEIKAEASSALKPEYLLLSSEPYPFKQKHANDLKQFFPDSKIRLVDGEMFSWYGSRMLFAPEYFKSLRNQE